MKEPARIRDMFSRIAPRYDLLNHLISFGQDARWRRLTCELLDVPQGGRVLDLCAGTGKLGSECVRQRPKVRVIATDFALPMLRLARTRAPVAAVCADALRLPFGEEAFDAVMAAFGVRSFGDLRAGLSEMHRVLRPGGQVVILELFRPKGGPLPGVFDVHLRRVMPWLGRLISGHDYAYDYLRDSVLGFMTQEEFATLLGELSFQGIRYRHLGFGVVFVFCARRGSGTA